MKTVQRGLRLLKTLTLHVQYSDWEPTSNSPDPFQRDLIKVLTILTLYNVMDLVVTALSLYPICRLDLLVVLLLRPYFRPT